MQPIDCKGIQCPIANRCKLQGVLGQAAQAFKNVLAQYQLEDLQQHDLQVIQKVFDVT